MYFKVFDIYRQRETSRFDSLSGIYDFKVVLKGGEKKSSSDIITVRGTYGSFLFRIIICADVG